VLSSLPKQILEDLDLKHLSVKNTLPLKVLNEVSNLVEYCFDVIFCYDRVDACW